MDKFDYGFIFFVQLVMAVAVIAKFYNKISIDTTAIITSMGCFTDAIILALSKNK